MHDQHAAAGSANGAAYGLINSLRTGNIIFDMVIAMLVPALFRILYEKNTALVTWLYSILERRRRTGDYVRVISHCSNSRTRGLVGESKNELLQKALTLYFNDQKIPFKHRANVSLTSIHERQNRYDNTDRRLSPLEEYRVTWLAPDNEWIELEQLGISFRQYQHNVGEDAKASADKKEMLVFELKCSEHDGHKRIDNLIETAVEWYKNELLKLKDVSRYMYVMQACDAWSLKPSDKLEDLSCLYKRYKLSDTKTFASLFFPHKESLLTLLEDFQQQRGKYQVEGYPRKLGLLLHGPPGTGKTSLIKALAHHTGRSIINIPLAQIKTNQRLMDVMYDLKLKVEGSSDEALSLQYKDVIFVIEDVDCANKIVLRREGAATSTTTTAAPGATDESEPSAVHRTALAQLESLAQSELRGASMSGGAKVEEEGPKPAGVLDAMESLMKPKQDALNLAGLLNVLDGVVDTPERLIIMTSNHPEKLDPALIRPGRIDLQVFLGYLQPPAAIQMIEHYFSTQLDGAQKARLERALAPLRDGSAVQFTPAIMEMLCAQHTAVNALIDAIERHLASADSGTGKETPFEAMSIARQKSGG